MVSQPWPGGTGFGDVSTRRVLFGSLTVPPSFCHEKLFYDYYLTTSGSVNYVPEKITQLHLVFHFKDDVFTFTKLGYDEVRC